MGSLPYGYKFVVGEREGGEELELAVHGKPPPGPSHKEIAEAVGFLVPKAQGGILQIPLDDDGFEYVDGGSTTLPSGGASEKDFNTALASGMLWLVK